MQKKKASAYTDIRIDISRAKSTVVGPEHGVTPGDLREITGFGGHASLLNHDYS